MEAKAKAKRFLEEGIKQNRLNNDHLRLIRKLAQKPEGLRYQKFPDVAQEGSKEELMKGIKHLSEAGFFENLEFMVTHYKPSGGKYHLPTTGHLDYLVKLPEEDLNGYSIQSIKMKMDPLLMGEILLATDELLEETQ